MKERVVFRADASALIGSGHIVRCLALAHELGKAGWRIIFVAREMPPALRELVRKAGHVLRLLPPHPEEAARSDDGPGTCAHWLRVPWQVDAEQTAALVHTLGGADWLVVDHYAIDARWEKMLRPLARRILVLDDLADRPHDCDMLVDELVIRRPREYAGLVPETCQVLTGAEHALLRPEFRRLRPSALQRRRECGTLRRVLVMFGGGTERSFLLRTLEIVTSILPDNVEMDVALGAMRLTEEDLAKIGRILSGRGAVHDFSANMARLMHDADMAIGASGMGAYERCCMGLPSVQFIQADNQRGTAEYFQRAGVALTIDATGPSYFRELRRAVERLVMEDALRREMVRRAASLVDGEGARRIRGVMEEA